MPLKIIRPPVNPDKKKELTQYLLKRWQQAVDARRDQIEDDYDRWTKNYRGVPREKKRTLPWYGASNFVVKLIRIYVDTFIARTLNIIFATKPLYTIDGYPRELKEAAEAYVNRKALYDWKHYKLAHQMLFRGTKNGTVFLKTIQYEHNVIDVRGDVDPTAEKSESIISVYKGPRTYVIPFEDLYLYPITANDMDEVQITFHKVRYTGEAAKQKMADPDIQWDITPEELDTIVKVPHDIKREEEQQDAGIHDYNLEEVQLIESQLEWPITNDPNRYYSVVALLSPDLNRIVDLYYNPYPANAQTIHRYAPVPREDLIYGESWCELLEQCQEEASAIHNDRRNASFLGSAPVFKKKDGARIPDPSTNWYPSKVFVVEEMDDFDVVNVGRQIGDLLSEENSVYSAADMLTGVGREMQGASQGQSDRGIYNTQGTLAVMAEGNQRQDTNIRDVREVMGEIAKTSFLLQATFGADDPIIDKLFSEDTASQIRQALQITDFERLRATQFEVKTSNAGANSEAYKASLIQMSNVLGTYSQTLQQLGPQILGAGGMNNPQMRALFVAIVKMQAGMAKTLMRGYDLYELEDLLPDVNGILGAPEAGPQPGPNPGGTGAPNGTAGLVPRPQLQQAAQLPGQFGMGGPPR